MRRITTSYGQGDVRSSVTIEEDVFGSSVRFYFTRVVDENGAAGFVNVGVEISRLDVAEGEEVVPLSPAAVGSVTDRFVRWVELARYALLLDHDKANGMVSDLKRPKPTRIDDDWLRMIAAEYRDRTERGEPAVTGIAKTHDVTTSAASRWVTRARKRGFLD